MASLLLTSFSNLDELDFQLKSFYLLEKIVPNFRNTTQILFAFLANNLFVIPGYEFCS